MNLLRLFCLLIGVFLVGCGPNVPGPSGEAPSTPEEEVFDETEEAAANPVGEE